MGSSNRDLAYLSTAEIRKKNSTAAATTALTTVTFSAPSTPDYAVQDLTTSTPYGFVTADEGQTLLSVVANLQARVNELEDILQALDLAV
jgi:hypothetical protein